VYALWFKVTGIGASENIVSFIKTALFFPKKKTNPILHLYIKVKV
jgi:hypothetical protein